MFQMSAKDLFHNHVKNALIKDGWTITHDPYPLKFGEETVQVDIGAEAPLGAEKDGRRIAVEIKGFVGRSPTTDLERALGQYGLYRFLMARREAERVLFLAVTESVYDRVFDTADARDLIAAMNILLLIFDPSEERIVRWII